MRHFLRDQREFQNVYRNGKRYDGRFISVFVICNEGLHHRLGVTASKKAIGNAVQRNRAKRLLRETFRFNGPSLGALTVKYDWVLNAKATLLTVKLESPAEEFAGIVDRVNRSEKRSGVDMQAR